VVFRFAQVQPSPDSIAFHPPAGWCIAGQRALAGLGVFPILPLHHSTSNDTCKKEEIVVVGEPTSCCWESITVPLTLQGWVSACIASLFLLNLPSPAGKYTCVGTSTAAGRQVPTDTNYSSKVTFCPITAFVLVSVPPSFFPFSCALPSPVSACSNLQLQPSGRYRYR
ncbi:hypothetical protein CH063_15945, partial [Colletotrichum higginsianum]